jgi:hypothetical protein
VNGAAARWPRCGPRSHGRPILRDDEITQLPRINNFLAYKDWKHVQLAFPRSSLSPSTTTIASRPPPHLWASFSSSRRSGSMFGVVLHSSDVKSGAAQLFSFFFFKTRKTVPKQLGREEVVAL